MSGGDYSLMMILAKRAHAHMKAGSLTGLSIGYILKDWEYDREKGVFLLKEIDLWEVSLVTFPSNDEARISDVKNALARGEILIRKLLSGSCAMLDSREPRPKHSWPGIWRFIPA